MSRCWSRRVGCESLGNRRIAGLVFATVIVLLSTTGCFLRHPSYYLDLATRASYSKGEISLATFRTHLLIQAGESRYALPRTERWQLGDVTTFGIDLPVGRGEVTVSGTVQAETAGASTPRKVLLRLLHRDAAGRKKGRFQTTLKIRGGVIKEVTKPFPGFDILEGDRVETLLKVRGPEFGGDHTITLTARFVDLDLRGASGHATGALQNPRPAGHQRTGLDISDGERQLILTRSFATPRTFPAGPWEVRGTYFEEGERVSEPATRGPTQVRVTMRHVGPDAEVLQQLKFRLVRDGNQLLPDRVAADALEFAAGDLLELLVQPIGGDIGPDDAIELFFEYS